MPRRVADYLDERRLHRPQPDLDRRRVPARARRRCRSCGTSWRTLRGAARPAGRRPVGRARPSSGPRRRRPPPENFDRRRCRPIRSNRPVWDLRPPRRSTDRRRHGRSARRREPTHGDRGAAERPRGRRARRSTTARCRRGCSSASALFVLVIGAVYWATAYEESGTVMLVLAGGPVAVVRDLPVAAPAGGRAGADGPAAVRRGRRRGPRLPAPHGRGRRALPAPRQRLAVRHRPGRGDRSPTGSCSGCGSSCPGVALLALGIGGFVRQTRRRD